MNVKNILLGLARIIPAVILLQTLYFKFTGHPDSVALFSELGAEPFGRIGIGVFELIAGLLLLIPKTTRFGAFISLGLMVGAIGSHLFVLGIDYNNDGGTLFFMAVIVFVFSASLVYYFRKALINDFKKLLNKGER